MASKEFDWNKFAELADNLADEANLSEEVIRTSISRYYYAAFHLSKSAFNIEDSKGKDGHNRVWKAITHKRTTGSHLVGTYGYRLKELRQKADYDSEKVIKADLDHAQRCFDQINNTL